LNQFLTLLAPLAWPLASLVIALAFRRDVGQALGRVGRVKYRDLELTFGDGLQRAEQLAQSLPPMAEKPSIILEAAVDTAEPLVGQMISPLLAADGPAERTTNPIGLRPRDMIEAAWGDVARASKAPGRKPTTGANLGELVDLLSTLRARAKSPDQPGPSPEHARRFAEVTRRVVARIEQLG
jgi:hypothetical protein